MSRNLVKGGYVLVSGDSTITIDNNEMIRKKLEELQQKQQEEPIPEVFEEGFSEGIDPVQVARLVEDPEETEQYSADANAIILEARDEAEAILDAAREEAASIREAAQKEGYEAGYSDGKAGAEQSFMSKSAELEEEYNRKESALESAYNDKLAEMEPLLIDKLTEIYEHVLGVSLSDSTQTVVFLLKRALSAMDSNKKYIIHVSKDDYDSVTDYKSSLSKASGIQEECLEIIEDHSLEKNGCMIESDGGIFDVGLDTQMNLLRKQLKILSMTTDTNH